MLIVRSATVVLIHNAHNVKLLMRLLLMVFASLVILDSNLMPLLVEYVTLVVRLVLVHLIINAIVALRQRF